MYIPKTYKWNNEEEITSFIKQNSFGLLVSSSLHGVHIPLSIKKIKDTFYLEGHIAKVNEVLDVVDKNVLVVFSGPHAYISPSLYTNKNTVPTWDYLAVHVYGQFELIEDYTSKIAVLEDTILTYEKEYLNQWKVLSDDYKNQMVKAITVFRVKVDRFEATAKLSQNKTPQEIKNIKEALLNSGSETKVELANYMNKLIK